ncbi:glycosyltransferase family 2 protein [Patescibacteria group bacterium]|nr:glycosyltransferase family 2 protein [Patescibacteria group bacterium]
MSNLPKIGIIFLTYPTANWERDINRCLASMEKLTYPKDRLELICVESKGKIAPVKPWFDQTWMPKSGVTLPRITYILKDEWIGFSGNNNLGFEKAKELGCDYVHLTNEDTDVEPDYIDRAVERAEADPKIAYVQSLILLGEERDRVNTIGNAFHILGFGYSNGYRWTKQRALDFFEAERKTNPDLEIGYASGAAVLGRVSAIDACGGLFDEKFYSYHEDTDASLQARMRGWKTVVEPSSVIHHYYEFGKSKINYYWMERNRYVLMFSFYRGWTLCLLSPLMIIMDVAITVFSIKNGWWDMKWKVYKDLCSSAFWKWVMERRKKIQAERVISDAEFLKHATPVIDFQEEHVRNSLLDQIGNPVMKGYWEIIRNVL